MSNPSSMVLAPLSPFPSTRPFLPLNPNPKPLIRTWRGSRYRDRAPSKAISLVPRRTPTEPATATFLSSGRSGRPTVAIPAAQISGETVQSNAEKWSKTAMLVIDMQNDFILPESPMCVAGGQAIVPSVIQAISVARERGIFVIWVVREHDPLGRDVELFRRHLYTDGKGPATNGSKGADLVDGLLIKEGDYKLVKTRFSALCATQLHSLLQTSGVKSLVVVGVQTPNCIRQTVFDAVSLDYQSVTVIVDATAAATEIHLGNIRDMKNIGVAIPTLQGKICEELQMLSAVFDKSA